MVRTHSSTVSELADGNDRAEHIAISRLYLFYQSPPLLLLANIPHLVFQPQHPIGIARLF